MTTAEENRLLRDLLEEWALQHGRIWDGQACSCSTFPSPKNLSDEEESALYCHVHSSCDGQCLMVRTLKLLDLTSADLMALEETFWEKRRVMALRILRRARMHKQADDRKMEECRARRNKLAEEHSKEQPA